MPHISLFAPYDPVDARALLPFCELIAASGFHRFWQGQGLRSSPTMNAAYLAGAGQRLPYGFGVKVTGLQHPYTAAQEAMTLATQSAHGVVAGLGPGGRDAQIAVNGAPYASVLGHMSDYASRFSDSLGGRRGFGSSAPGVEIGFGVLRTRMAELCGARADAAITWLCPPEYIAKEIAPALARGAAAAGRDTPRIVSMVPCAAGLDLEARPGFLTETIGNHLRLAHYRDMLSRAGIVIAPGQQVDDTLGERFTASGLCAIGTDEQILATCQRYFDAGVDEVVLNFSGTVSAIGVSAAIGALLSLDGSHRRLSSL